MESYMISFSLDGENGYERVSRRIRRYPKWAKVMDSVWIVCANDTSVSIRDQISDAMGESGGSVIVVRISGSPWATSAVNKEVTSWMKENV